MEEITVGHRQSEFRGRVLVVDDSRLVRAIVSRYLEKAGYHTDQAGNGAEALRRLAQEDFDVVITDLRMPELDGFVLLASVKRLAPTVEVIILTGTHAQDIRCAIRALRLGAHDYLTKPPANADEVVLTVQRAVEKKRLQEANHRLIHELESLCLTDALTGVPNRRCFDKALDQEIARARRRRHTLGLMVLDLDHFKRVNDTHGHQGGDEVLRSVARIVSAGLREGDVLYRYGGEEFVALMPDTDIGGAMKAAWRVVKRVAGSPIQVGSAIIAVGISAGVACLATSDTAGADLVARADAALYQAKNAGRNRAHAARPHLRLAAGRRAG